MANRIPCILQSIDNNNSLAWAIRASPSQDGNASAGFATSMTSRSNVDPYKCGRAIIVQHLSPECPIPRLRSIQLTSNRCSHHCGSQSLTSLATSMEPFDSPPLASHCSTGTPKMIMPPGSMILGNSEVRRGLIDFCFIDVSTLRMLLSMSCNYSPRPANPLLLAWSRKA